MPWREILDKLIGDKETEEGIEPSMSPLDFIPYEGLAVAGARGLGKIAASDATKKFLADEGGFLSLRGVPRNTGLAQKAEQMVNVNPSIPQGPKRTQDILNKLYQQSAPSEAIQTETQKLGRQIDFENRLKAQKAALKRMKR